MLDNLPKMVAKAKVRATIAEIVDAEGPIHLDRLAQLVAASFGVRKLHTTREAKIKRQVTASGYLVDKSKFVWPDSLAPGTWAEFRPNSSQLQRPFLHVSPVEIANAMRLLRTRNADATEVAIDAMVLQTFGRRRRTRQFATHLAKARDLLAD